MKTPTSKYFKIENAKTSKLLQNTEWGDGYDDSIHGSPATITRKDLKNIWLMQNWQKFVRDETVAHFVKNGLYDIDEDMNTGVPGPIRLVEYAGKFYIHDGCHRMAAAIIRNEPEVKVHLWRLNQDFMTTQEAFEIVYELASSACTTGEYSDPKWNAIAKKQQLALDTVHDYLVNNIFDTEVEDEPRIKK